MRLHNLFENTTPESLIEDIIDIELTDDFAIEGRIVEFNEDGSITVELDEQAQELVDLDEEVLNEFIPLAIGAAALAKVEPSALPATGAATGNAAGKTTAKKADDVKAKKKAARKKAGKRLRRAGMGAYGSVDYDDPLQRAVSNFSFESEDEFEPHMMYDPETGEGKMAHTEADHLKMKDMGWTHDNPKTKEIEEAEYQGRKVKLGKPMAGDVKKFKVYVKNPKGNVVKVNFGQKGVKIKKNNPARRKSFRARHNCDNPGPRHKARYWSCRKW